MDNPWVVVGLVIMLIGVGGVLFGVYESFTSPDMAILGILSQSAGFIVLGFILWLIGWKNARKNRPRNPP